MLLKGGWRYHFGPLMNELGAQGWELVGIQVLPAGSTYTVEAQWIFKRPATLD